MLKTTNVVIAAVSLSLLCCWVVQPLTLAADESQADPAPVSPEDVRQAGTDRMHPGRMDPKAMHHMMLGRMKIQLAARDQEWVAIEPLLDKVMTLSNEVNPRGMAMMGERSDEFTGQPGWRSEQPQRRNEPYGRRVDQAKQSEMQKASIALREVLQKTDSTSDEVNGSLAAFRTAKEIAQKELVDEQNKLKRVVNTRQEAKLVLIGMLD